MKRMQATHSLRAGEKSAGIAIRRGEKSLRVEASPART